MSNIKKEIKEVLSQCFPLEHLFKEKLTVDFYQREYVWERKQLEDLINDLSNAFLKCWRPCDSLDCVRSYDPYFMGEVILSIKASERSAIIDGQQRVTTLTLLLIYLLNNFKNVKSFPMNRISSAIFEDDYGTPKFNLDIDVRENCMLGLFKNGNYCPNEKDRLHVQNILDRYNDISDCWNEKINEQNISSFAYWLLEKVLFSKVWTNSDEFAYVIFETMNDRGLSLTPVEMLRSYLLSNIDVENRGDMIEKFDGTIKRLTAIKLSSKSKAEQEFFKVFLRGLYARDLSQSKDQSDFVMIGNAFHRWVRDKEGLLGLNNSKDYVNFIKKIDYFSTKYEYIYKKISERNSNKYLYLIVNSDYGFTMQTAVILSSICYINDQDKDSDETVDQKIQLISKYLTKVLTWRVWNHWMISQSSLEAPTYDLCKKIRGLSIEDIKSLLKGNPIEIPELKNSPTLNQQNKRRIKVLLGLITEIVAKGAQEPNYMLNNSNIEIEHIWSNHFEEHKDEFNNEDEFSNCRNNIGDLLLLKRPDNASFNDEPYVKKVKQYFNQNILAQSLNKLKYENNPNFKKFIDESKLPFKSYDDFKKDSIADRADLYKFILLYNWQEK